MVARYPDLSEKRLTHEIIRRLINLQIIDLVETSQQAITAAAPADIDAVRAHPEPLIRFSDAMREANQELKGFLRRNLYQHYRVHRMTDKARRILQDLFTAFMQDPKLLKPEHQARIRQLEAEDGEAGRARAVADYIAGMTDRFAITEHRRIFAAEELT